MSVTTEQLCTHCSSVVSVCVNYHPLCAALLLLWLLLCRTVALNPPEAEVYTYAVQYITVRSWGILAAMLGFVASGTYRQVLVVGFVGSVVGFLRQAARQVQLAIAGAFWLPSWAS
jgi:hypothetical protein